MKTIADDDFMRIFESRVVVLNATTREEALEVLLAVVTQ